MVNERFISLRKTPVPFELQHDQDVKITVGDYEFTATVTGINSKSNQDGTVDLTYKLQFFPE